MIHLQAGHEWSGPLHRTLQQCKLAATRGQGPTKKKAIEVPEDVWAQKFGDKVNKKVKLIEAQRLFAVGVQWMMREIEIADLTLEKFTSTTRTRRCVSRGTHPRQTQKQGPSPGSYSVFVDKKGATSGAHMTTSRRSSRWQRPSPTTEYNTFAWT